MQLVAVVVVCFLCLAQAFTLRVRVRNGVQRQHKLQQQLKIASPLMQPLSGTSTAVVIAPPTIFSKAKSHMRTTISAFSTFLMLRPITAAISAVCISALCVFCGLKYPKPITEKKHILNSTTTATDLKRTVGRIFYRPQLSSALLVVAVTGVSLFCRRVWQMLAVELRGISWRSNMVVVFLKANVVRVVVPVLLAVLGLVGGVFSFLWNERREEERLKREAEEKYENSLLFAERAAVASMLKPFDSAVITVELNKSAPSELWVERSEVRKKLTALRLTTGKYVVIMGEKGAGKSFVTYKFVLNEPGVVYLWLNTEIKAENIQEKLLEATGFDVKKHPTVNPMPQLLRLLYMVEKELAPYSVVPMVIVEMERNSDPETVDTVFRAFKKMSAVCRSIVIISEAFGAMTMSPDSARRMELWVPPFTDAETREYLGKANKWRLSQGKLALSDAEIEDIITHLGGRPSTLCDVVTSSVPPAQFVEELIAEEKTKIKNLLQVESRYEPVLRLMLQKRTLSQDELIDMLDQPFKDIARLAMAEYHVLTYNPVSRTAQFHSRATEQAAKKWAEEEAKKWWFQK
jgi:hypothetical protein